MNEINRTLVFVAIAVVLTAVTYVTMPSADLLSPADMVGQKLFPQFEDPLVATGLEVVRFDEDSATPVTFSVRKEGNSWVIPPKNYPADAEDQLARAAAELIDLEVLGVAADPQEAGVAADDIQGLHRMYGVVDPGREGIEGGEGVGIRVTMRNKDDAKLVEMIIGKQVEGQTGLRYVRRVGQDPVYTVKVGTDKFSTKFEDWIEDDLLKLRSWDIRRVDIEDYSIDTLQGMIRQRGRLSLEHNDTGDPRWSMPVAQVFEKGKWIPKLMGEDEELDTDKLNDLRNALDDLKIVDVMRKPAGLSETLRGSGSISLDPEAESSLARAGFHVVTVSDPSNPAQEYLELRSNEGEIAVSMKDGVKYVLRFGQIASMTAGGAANEADAEDGNNEETAATSDVNRYLFVMAQLDRGMIEEPDYEDLPELPEEETTPEKPEPEAKPETPAGDGIVAAEETAEGEESEAEEKAGQPDPPEEIKPTREEIENQRQRIQEENDRKREEFEKKVSEAEEKVKELNARFADWYYVINDTEYQKIHLSRDKIVKQKEKEEDAEETAAAGVDSAPDPAFEPDSIGEFESLKLDAPSEP